MSIANLKKDDTVLVISGKERGKTGKVVRVIRDRGRVLVERINVVKRHQKGTSPQQPGGIVEKEAPIDVSNVMLVCLSCNKPTRVGHKRLEAKEGQKAERVRICRRCGDVLEQS